MLTEQGRACWSSTAASGSRDPGRPSSARERCAGAVLGRRHRPSRPRGGRRVGLLRRQRRAGFGRLSRVERARVPLGGLDEAEAAGAIVFHAGTALREGTLLSAGGRVLNVTALGDTVARPESVFNRAIELIDFPGMQYRRDIALRAARVLNLKPLPRRSRSSASSPTRVPSVGILIGSESDRETIEAAVEELNARGISNELRVLSAHRDPRGVAEYASTAALRGVRVIIAGAGMAAALPGVVAALIRNSR